MPEYKKQIEKLIYQLNLANNICIVNEVDQKTLCEYYNSADLVVSMARNEGFPNTLLEVMGCKVPIVVGRIPQIEELLQDNRNARICELQTHSISLAILDIIGNREKAQQLAEEAYATARQYADISKNGARFCNKVKSQLIVGKRNSVMSLITFRTLYLLFRIYRKLVGSYKRKVSVIVSVPPKCSQ
jgi:glycosyltransferase involved in cell wall biosynthesis